MRLTPAPISLVLTCAGRLADRASVQFLGHGCCVFLVKSETACPPVELFSSLHVLMNHFEVSCLTPLLFHVAHSTLCLFDVSTQP
jgi:hypothetical protein